MRCASYCTAQSYNLQKMLQHFTSFKQPARMIDDVLHLKHTDQGKTYDVFFFPYGCFTSWGSLLEEEKTLIQTIKPFENKPLHKSVEDIFKYHMGETTEINEEDDDIILEEDDAFIKLSLSHGLSQSAKLSTFEETITHTIESTRYLPRELAERGKISLSRKKLTQQLGLLFEERNSMNLHNDIMDIPEFFWRRPRYEPYYHMAAEYVDIKLRLDVLNKKLDVIHDLYDVLSHQLNHVYTSRLEIVIILLISIEVLLVVGKDILKVF